jgi:hypothetical protein
MKKKILFINYDLKNVFIKYLIKSLSKKFQVTIFSDKKVRYHNKFIIEKYKEEKIDRFFNYISNPLPSEKEKFYLSNSYKKKKNFRLPIILKLILSYLNFLPSKDYLYKRKYKNSNQYHKILKNFDYVICDARLSNLYNKNKKLIYEAIKNKNIKFFSWFYSWDNIYFNSVIKSADYVLIWSKSFKNIISKIHKYKSKQIISTGPLQFDYLKKANLIKATNKKKQILFACTYGKDTNKTGDNFYIDEKLFLIKLSNLMLKLNSKVKIIVRLYPSADINDFSDLKKLKNIEISDYGKIVNRRKKYSEKIRFEKKFNNKIKQIKNSTIIMSYGSTFNIEAAYLNKLVFHIDFSYNDIFNQKFKIFRDKMEYLNFLKFKSKNIISNEKHLEKILKDIFVKQNEKNYKLYGKKLKNIFCNELNKNLTVYNFAKHILDK